MMLPADIVLLEDPQFRKYVELVKKKNSFLLKKILFIFCKKKIIL